jgi:hypothetical protein
MGLGLSLSGVSNAGHDIGGFAGPAPDPELFVRWVEAGVFMPRFSIHSWNDDGSSNEPWMHPEVTPLVRELIRLRYELMPYLYDLCWRHTQGFEPIARPTFVEFPDDPRTYDDCDELMLGPALLVASVVEPGATTPGRVRDDLPRGRRRERGLAGRRSRRLADQRERRARPDRHRRPRRGRTPAARPAHRADPAGRPPRGVRERRARRTPPRRWLAARRAGESAYWVRRAVVTTFWKRACRAAEMSPSVLTS